MVHISHKMQFAIGPRVAPRFVLSVVVKTLDVTGFGLVQFSPQSVNAALLTFGNFWTISLQVSHCMVGHIVLPPVWRGIGV